MPGANDQENQPGAGDDKNDDQKPPVVPPGEEEAGDADDEELFKDPAKAKALVEKLRKENAKNRVKGKENSTKLSAMEQTLGKLKAALGGDENLSPEEQVAKLKSEKEQLIAEREAAQTDAEITRISREYEIPTEHDKYFRFLLAQKFDGLEDGEELDEEALNEVVKEVRAIAGKPNGNKTGIDGKKPSADGKGEVTVEQFVAMNLGERTQIYTKDPALYERLMTTAKEKRLL